MSLRKREVGEVVEVGVEGEDVVKDESGQRRADMGKNRHRGKALKKLRCRGKLKIKQQNLKNVNFALVPQKEEIKSRSDREESVLVD